ncbi:MAG: hypothetical protein J0H09_14125 [Burkholderiales bacterium]|nr:hypothetical protein [Burkholderiales bacterium]
MSIYTVERVMYEIAGNPEVAKAYASEPAAFLARYPLEPDEVGLIRALDFRELTRRGLNHMLAMRAFSALHGRDRVPEYLRALKE